MANGQDPGSVVGPVGLGRSQPCTKEGIMVFKMRSVSLGLLLVVALSALVASSAFAAEVQPKYVKNGKAITTQTKVKGILEKFFIEVSTVKFIVGCEGVDGSASVEGEGRSKLVLEFTKCKVFNLDLKEEPNCKVAEPVQLKLANQLVYKNGKKSEEALDIYYRENAKFANGVWFVLKMEGALCIHAGAYSVKGSAIAAITPNKNGTEEATQKVKFNGLSSPLGSYENHVTNTVEEAGKLALETSKETSTASLTGALLLELTSGEKFGVI